MLYVVLCFCSAHTASNIIISITLVDHRQLLSKKARLLPAHTASMPETKMCMSRCFIAASCPAACSCAPLVLGQLMRCNHTLHLPAMLSPCSAHAQPMLHATVTACFACFPYPFFAPSVNGCTHCVNARVLCACLLSMQLKRDSTTHPDRARITYRAEDGALVNITVSPMHLMHVVTDPAPNACAATPKARECAVDEFLTLPNTHNFVQSH